MLNRYLFGETFSLIRRIEELKELNIVVFFRGKILRENEIDCSIVHTKNMHTLHTVTAKVDSFAKSRRGCTKEPSFHEFFTCIHRRLQSYENIHLISHFTDGLEKIWDKSKELACNLN